MNEILSSSIHPETAWLINATPSALAAAALLVAVLLLRGPLSLALATMQSRRAQGARGRTADDVRPDPALVWAPETIDPRHALAVCAGVVVALAAALGMLAPIFLALVLSAPLAALFVWGLLVVAERSYIARLDRDLTAAMGRLSALLKSGSGFRAALERIVVDLPRGPLHAEWAFLLTRQGAPLASGGLATPQQVVAALNAQTTSARHATLLSHLSVAVGQPQDVLARRCEAAYAALQASDRRREEAITELAQVRYSGMAVGLAGIAMASYLAFTQWERVVVAYSSPFGAIVGVIVVVALLLPIIGGLLLAQVDDVDY